MSTVQIDYTNCVFCAIIWPRANFSKNRDKILGEFQDCKVITEKDCRFSRNKFRYLISQVYSSHPWIGSAKNHYFGSARKGFNCFKKDECCHFIFFEAKNIEKVLSIKKRVREMMGMGNHSIHITDNNNETIQIERLILNDNSLDFISKGKPDHYPSIEKKIQRFTKQADEVGIDRSDYAFDSSVILGLYGLRRPRDIDFLTTNDKCKSLNVSDCDCHNDCEYYDQTVKEMLDNQDYYFWWNGNKYISIDVVLRMKRKRNEKKDRIDVYLIENIRGNNSLSVRIVMMMVNFVNECKLIVRNIYKKIKNLIHKKQQYR